MIQLDAQRTAQALPYAELVDALRAMLARKRAGVTQAPERLAVPLPGGTLLAMPACDGEYASTKLVTVHADNPERGLASIQGEVILMRAATGERLLLLDGPTVTARRTAALSALGARTLGAASSDTAMIVGAGAQARAHVDALAQVLGIHRFLVASRTRASVDALLRYGRDAGLQMAPVDRLADAVRDATLIVTATTSREPVLPDVVGPGAVVIAIGAYRPEMCELPASLVSRARLVVDDPAGARHEAGDFIRAGVDWRTVEAIEDLAAPDPASPGIASRPASPAACTDRPVVFKTVGQALWDLAACRLALARQ
jgi:ornithine cyclodeaminase/alanine dehydrogenase-like protein (mu-crystallin family)